jgi:hypothetical protein
MNSTALIICIFEISRNGGNLYFFLTKREFRHLHFYIQLKDNINEKNSTLSITKEKIRLRLMNVVHLNTVSVEKLVHNIITLYSLLNQIISLFLKKKGANYKRKRI